MPVSSNYTQQGIRVSADMHCLLAATTQQGIRVYQETCTACLLAATTQQGIRVPGDMHYMLVSYIPATT